MILTYMSVKVFAVKLQLIFRFVTDQTFLLDFLNFPLEIVAFPETINYKRDNKSNKDHLN